MKHFFRPLNGIQYLTLGLVVIMAAGFIYGFSQIEIVLHRLNQQAVAAAQTHTALCASRKNTEEQISASEKFLEQNPNGIPGIQASLIVQGINRQKAYVAALDGLSCPAKS